MTLESWRSRRASLLAPTRTAAAAAERLPKKSLSPAPEKSLSPALGFERVAAPVDVRAGLAALVECVGPSCGFANLGPFGAARNDLVRMLHGQGVAVRPVAADLVKLEYDEREPVVSLLRDASLPALLVPTETGADSVRRRLTVSPRPL